MSKMTERQQEIKALLDEGLGAREVADVLGISRNAVYQQIQRLRRAGELEPGFTPTGVPPREGVPGSAALAQILGMAPPGPDDVAAASAIALLHEIKRTRDELGEIVHRLSSMLPR